MTTKAYLGDGTYVDFDGDELRLTSEDGSGETNRIRLKPKVYRALTECVARLPERAGLTASLRLRPSPKSEA